MEWAAIAAIIGAIAGATSGLVGTIQTGKEEWTKANDYQKYIDDLYLENVKQADEEFAKAKEEADRNADQADAQADLTDQSLDITETAVSNDINTAIDNLYLSQAGNALSWNNAAMQAGSSEGAAYASLAGSGVRAGSSLSDAVLMESAVNESQLQFSKDAQRRSDNNNLGSILNNLAGNQFNIYQNRVGADVTRDNADYLRNSYLEGGHNYNLYSLQKTEMEKTWQYNHDTLQKQKEKWWKDGHMSWDAFWTGATNMLSLGAKGASTGYNLYDMSYKAANYTKTIEG